MGINRTISISKTIKITASKKNRSENGIRALWLGSNPHSKGDLFSVSKVDRIIILHDSARRAIGIISAVIEDTISIFIN